MVSNEAAIPVGDRDLSLLDVVRVAREQQKVADLNAEVKQRVQKSASWVEKVVEDIELKGKKGEKVDPYYGINTGFGAKAGRKALRSKYLTKLISRNLITSHSVGVGEYLDEETVRAAMLIRAHALAQGYSGVRPLIIQKLIAMLNKRVYPSIPSQGSLGASGDLAPLSHLALIISKVPEPDLEEQRLFDIPPLDPTSGEAFVPYKAQQFGNDLDAVTYHITVNRGTGEQMLWQRVSGEQAMASVDGQIELLAKEGLAINNGATFSTAIGALTLYDSWNLLKHAELALSMTLEAIRGFRDPFFPMVHEVRGHPGAKTSAEFVLRYVQGSELLDPADRGENPERMPPQDFYSVRCAPQVLGSVRDTLTFVQGIIETELNAATDNPLIFLDEDALPRSYKMVSCGNFHGEPIAMAMDFLGIAITELGNIAERRIFKLTEYVFPKPEDQAEYGLDSFLIKEKEENDGLNSGLMLTQYTAASLVSNCKTLAHPDSVDSIPSSANKEDHVSMSLNAALHAREIADNIESVIAIEFLCAAQALDLRLKRHAIGAEKSLGTGTRAAYQRIREEVKYLDFDRVLYPDIRKLIQLIRSGELVHLARLATKSVE
jgi:histidine ammonia-lyase